MAKILVIYKAYFYLFLRITWPVLGGIWVPEAVVLVKSINVETILLILLYSTDILSDSLKLSTFDRK